MSNLGKYIVLEGDEGSGKGTQCELLLGKLTELGYRCEVVREPGGDPIAEQLREILKYSDHHIPPIAELFGFLMARAQVLVNVVRPKIEAGYIVLSDRSSLSTLVYQGEMRGLLTDVSSPTYHQVIGAVQLAQSIVEPDMVIVLDIPYETTLERIASRGEDTDRFESVGDSKRRMINNAYRRFGNSEDDNICMVDGSLSIRLVSNAVWNIVAPIIQQVQQHQQGGRHG